MSEEKIPECDKEWLYNMAYLVERHFPSMPDDEPSELSKRIVDSLNREGALLTPSKEDRLRAAYHLKSLWS